MRILLLVALSCQICFAQNWQPLGSGLDYFTTTMYTDTVSDQLLVSGWFSMADTVPVNGITNYDGSFHSMWPGFPTCPTGSAGGDVWAMQRYGSWIYFGGNFDCLGGISNTSSLARWNGSIWDSVPGGGISFQGGAVGDMTVYNNELYICGTFTSVSGVAANRIAKFDGTSWSSVAGNYNFSPGDILNRIAFYHGNLYIGGNIHDPQGNLHRMAVWDGSSWQFSSIPSGGSAGVWDLEVYNDELYVCGEFYFDDGNAGTSIMRWNDTTWRDVGGSVQEYASGWSVMKEMQVHNGKLYCVGGFQMVGNVEARGLAAWDGAQWCGYGANFGATQPFQFVGPSYIEFYRDTMYVSGGFMYIDSLQVNFIAKWVGGSYVDTCGTAVSIPEVQTLSSFALVYPNPSYSTATFQFSNDAPREIIITDQLGREILHEETTEQSIAISVESFAEGLYFYSIVGENDEFVNGKFIVAR